MLLQHDCLLSELYVYYGTYSLLHRPVEKRRHVQDIFYVYVYYLLSCPLISLLPRPPFIAAADFLSPTTHTCITIVLSHVQCIYYLLSCPLTPLLRNCNWFTAQEKANTTVEGSRGDMEAAYVKKATEDLQLHTKRFQHYYDRYNNHLHSLDVSGGA